MGGSVRAGGCERCGRTEDVTYKGWVYLCKACREEMEREHEQEARRAILLAKAESAETAKPGTVRK